MIIYQNQLQRISRIQFRRISHTRNPFRGISRNPLRGISRNPLRGISRNPLRGISRASIPFFLICVILLLLPVKDTDSISITWYSIGLRGWTNTDSAEPMFGETKVGIQLCHKLYLLAVNIYTAMSEFLCGVMLIRNIWSPEPCGHRAVKGIEFLPQTQIF